MNPRIASPELEARRKDRMTRFFLTGGTGFLGSHLAAELLRKGYSVSLLARSGDKPAHERVSQLLDWFGLPDPERVRLKVVEGDIDQPMLGIDRTVLPAVLDQADEIIHCASNTSFSKRKRPEVEAANIGGLSRVLEFAGASRACFFHHLSTAYVAGKVSGPCPEEPVSDREFNNVYEETKCRGEQMVKTACSEAGIRTTIYRPTIVYGDSRTGKTLRFNAVYHPVRMALFIRDLCAKDIREAGGLQASAMGVTLEPDGTAHLPMRIEVAEQGGINVIPVDYFTSAFLALLHGAPEGGIFHIAADRLTRIEDLIEYGSRLFHLAGIRAGTAQEYEATPRNPLEMLYDHYIGAYAPYMRDTRVFTMTKSQPILDRDGIACPELDYAVFQRCMLYAVETGWGERLFTP